MLLRLSYSSYMDTLYKQIRSARKRMKLTQVELAKKAGIAQGDLSNIERGQVDARMSTLIRLAMALELDLIAVPRSHKNKVMNIIREENEEPQDLSLLERYGVPDDE